MTTVLRAAPDAVGSAAVAASASLSRSPGNHPDVAVFILRAQPFHFGHQSVIRRALEQAHHVVLLLGSALQPRTPMNPFTHNERAAMIRASFNADENARIQIVPLMDVLYNDPAWITNIRVAVQRVLARVEPDNPDPKIALIGHSKDESSYYLRLFPEWQSIDCDNFRGINATDLRRAIFDAEGDLSDEDAPVLSYLRSVTPDPVIRLLRGFMSQPELANVVEEDRFIQNYKAGWKASPYPPTFVTVSAVVVQSGHVLLVERKTRPGLGLTALPGGFVREDESLEDGVIRELREDTRIKVPEAVLRGSIRSTAVFDYPKRSARGRTISHTHLIQLRDSTSLPRVRGGEERPVAFWLPFHQLDPQRMFEDHYHIIRALIGTSFRDEMET
ncbi:MAG: ADP-ribose pyrophosphatase [Kiloniella sp.]|nr:ADP-ribose pyrophosphatase [Kiloniella sp.]